MGQNTLLRLVVLAILVIVAISIVNYLVRHLFGIIFSVALVAGVLWLLMNAFSRKRSF